MDQTNFERCQTCIKNLLIKNRNPRCKLDCHSPPLSQISALQLFKKKTNNNNKGSDSNTGPLY